MECPICGSTAVVARICLEKHLDRIQEGLDPYDLLSGEEAQAECKTCGEVFNPESTDES
jgi:uncharacterized Zn finger protein